MDRRRWKLWVAGIALMQLLVIGVDAALLWPMPSEAEVVADRLRVGMIEGQARSLLDEGSSHTSVEGLGGKFFSYHSSLHPQKIPGHQWVQLHRYTGTPVVRSYAVIGTRCERGMNSG